MEFIPAPEVTRAERIKMGKNKSQGELMQDKYMEHEELAAVLEAMEVQRWALLTRFLCLSGLRIGELVALDDKDIDDEYIHVSKTYSLATHKVSTPKTAGSVRDVCIQPELAAVISDIRKYMRMQNLCLDAPSKLFFPDEDGGYLHYDNYRIYFKSICKKTIGRPITPHACRHTMVSEGCAPYDSQAVQKTSGSRPPVR